LFGAIENKLKHVVDTLNEKIIFSHEYGDGWTVSLVLEKVLLDKVLPRLLAGERFGMVADCGRVWVLREFKLLEGEAYETLANG